MAEATSKSPAPKKTAAKTVKTTAASVKAEPKTAAPPKKTVAKKAAPVVETKVAAEKKPAAAKKAAVEKTPAPVEKTPAPRKPAVKKAPVAGQVVTDEQRYRMIAEAAYYRAESCQFKSDPLRDWIEAERDISVLLSEGR